MLSPLRVDWCAGGEPPALHPLCGAAPEQKGCNAYGSGALPLRTSESVVGVCRGDCAAQGGRAASHRGEGCLALYPQSLVRVAGYPQGLIALMISTRGAARIHI